MLFCTWCDKEFIPNSNKQIYCGAECRQVASKEKILERYHIEKRKKRVGNRKKCAGGCGTVLSIYNDFSMCENCLGNQKKIAGFMKEIKDFFDYEQN